MSLGKKDGEATSEWADTENCKFKKYKNLVFTQFRHSVIKMTAKYSVHKTRTSIKGKSRVQSRGNTF